MASARLTAEQRAKIFKALADPHRLEIVDALAAGGSMCGTELAEQLDVSIALLCHHWDVLIDAGLVRKQRVGQLRVCTLDTAKLREATGAWVATLPSKGRRGGPKRGKAAKRRVARPVRSVGTADE
jgi:DNA-binding transcriptional ArsR family regulator